MFSAYTALCCLFDKVGGVCKAVHAHVHAHAHVHVHVHVHVCGMCDEPVISFLFCFCEAFLFDMKGHPVLPFTPDLACYVDFVSKVITEASAHTGARKPPRVAECEALSM